MDNDVLITNSSDIPTSWFYHIYNRDARAEFCRNAAITPEQYEYIDAAIHIEPREDFVARNICPIKTIEGDLRTQDPNVTLNSFIVSNTRLPEVSWWDDGMTKEEFEERHVLFQKEDKATYIAKILEMAIT